MRRAWARHVVFKTPKRIALLQGFEQKVGRRRKNWRRDA
jgi:hypothetical protein